MFFVRIAETRGFAHAPGNSLIRKNLLQLLFSGACLWRWNDKLRPVELTEIEKQGHKMLVACALWHEYSSAMPHPERMRLAAQIIEGGLFDYLYRLVITDIKPPVFYKIRQNREHYQRLTQYVLGKLEPVLAPTGQFWQRMRKWHLADAGSSEPQRRILAAAHLFASHWEFLLIRPHNSFDDEMDGIARSFDEELGAYADLPGMKALLTPGNALARFGNLCGQLRFQIRWAQAPRIPATSVLGHMFIVAACAYMFSLEVNATHTRACNNFFGGLFHDFPELLTRDIISPVKQSIPGLSRLIKEYESSELERRVLAPLRKAGFEAFARRISYYLGLEIGSEFTDCCRENGKLLVLPGFIELSAHDCDDTDPRDGQMLKTCDLLAAFLEAHNSIRTGISSPHLQEARARLKSRLIDTAPDILQLDALLADFE